MQLLDATTGDPRAGAATGDYRLMNLRIATVLAALALPAFVGACTDTAATNANAGGSGASSGLTSPGAGPGSQEDLANNVGDRVLFALDSSTLSGEARTVLDRQSEWLGRYPQVQVQMGGNCDERGTTEYNLALGQRRANAARDYLVARGVSSARVSAISYGKERPTATGSDEQAYAQNRNATTSVR